MNKKLIAMILVFALCYAAGPVVAHADSERDFRVTLEANTDTTVRDAPYQDGKVVVPLSEGDIVKVTKAVVNRHGNVWYQVITPQGEGFIYSEKTREHHCCYQNVDGCNNAFFCNCGNIIVANDEQSLQAIAFGNAAALPAPVDVLAPETLESLGLGLAGLGAAASAAAPYVVVLVVGGVVIYIAVHAQANEAVLVRASVEWRALNSDFRPQDGLYYDGMLKDGVMLVNVANPMDEYEAMKSIDRNINCYLNILEGDNRAKAPLWFVYTPLDLSAMCLAENYCVSRPGYGFCVENYWGDAHERSNCMPQFKHYHIVGNFEVPSPHLGGHIIFGAPCLDTYHEGAWA